MANFGDKLSFMKYLGALILFLLSHMAFAVVDSSLVNQFNKYFERAENYDNVSLFVEAVGQIDAAIELAQNQGWIEKELKAKIFMAELKRKTGDIDEGFKLLESLEIPEEYPELQVYKLNRLVALALEGGLRHYAPKESRKRVTAYLNQAIGLASQLDLRSDLADMYNQIGFYLRYEEKDTSLKYLKMASGIFWDLKDTANYIVSRTNEMRVYVHQADSFHVVSIFNELNPLFRGKKWYQIQMNLYELLIAFYENSNQLALRDQWQLTLFEVMYKFYAQSNNSLLYSYRTLYETEKYQTEANQKAEQLERESSRRRELALYFGILLILSFGIAALLLRERRLKTAVNKANDRYHMLLVESNHRIKNNLQMIISMLEYASKGLQNENSAAYKNISGKIQTISALHKHLYLDVHNEKVELDGYFKDILALYKDIEVQEYKILKDICSVSIQSERIVYFGLVLNEMLSNSFKHGNSAKNEIEINVQALEDRFQFSYLDHSNFELTENEGTGMQLIKQLVNRVEGTNFNFKGEKGQYQFEFYA